MKWKELTSKLYVGIDEQNKRVAVIFAWGLFYRLNAVVFKPGYMDRTIFRNLDEAINWCEKR